MEAILLAAVLEGKVEPKSTAHTHTQRMILWKSIQAQATDMSFFMHRQAECGTRNGWTNFNQTLIKKDHEITSVGYLPIIQAPSSWIWHIKHSSSSLQTCYSTGTTVVVDEALFGKLIELKQTKEEHEDCLIIRLGGLHTSLDFLKTITQHLQFSGLLDAWVDSNTLGPRTAEEVLAGKSYARGMRRHKLTLQALWRILMLKLLHFIHQGNWGTILDKIILYEPHPNTAINPAKE